MGGEPEHVSAERMQMLRDLGGADGGVLQQLLTMFLTAAPERVDAIKQAAVTGNGAELAAAVHRLRGSCLSLGIPRLADLCGRLEDVARGGQLEAAGAMADDIAAELEHVERALQRELDR